MSLLRGLSPPAQRFLDILSHAYTAKIRHAELELSLGFPALGSRAYLRERLPDISTGAHGGALVASGREGSDERHKDRRDAQYAIDLQSHLLLRSTVRSAIRAHF
jgi:hypothetical protein